MSYTVDPLTTPTVGYDRWTMRRLDSRGGPPNPPGIGHVIAPGLIDNTVREGRGADVNDRLTRHERMPWYSRDYTTGTCDTRVNWTLCGPIRPSLHVLQTSLNKQVGTDNTRNFDPHPITGFGSQDQHHGMHTNPQPNRVRTTARYRSTVQQQPARVNRLSSARYTGQSYSQTTRTQGGR